MKLKLKILGKVRSTNEEAIKLITNNKINPTIISAINQTKGKGTMGKLMKDEKMYNNFTKASSELELLLQDLRLNPTRYINVSVFGKKNKPYIEPKETVKN